MTKEITVAIDAMGGDGGPDMAVRGTALAAKKNPDVSFLLFGDEKKLKPLVSKFSALKERVRVIHTDQHIDGDAKPSLMVRRGRKSSMGLAIEAVKKGEAEVAISAGNTGALMALAKVLLRTMPGIDRPALATLIPAMERDSVMLDLGANVESNEDNLVQFAIMGAAFARVTLKLRKPRVALLNVGVEELKGNEMVKNAGKRLKDTKLPMEFAGFTEGDGIGTGAMDVVVTDGFTGNVALKTAEGTAKLVGSLVRQAFLNSWLAKIGFLFARIELNKLKEHLDPNNHNGAVFLGLNGLVLKSHGGATPVGFAQAIQTGLTMKRRNLIELIREDLKNFEEPVENMVRESKTA